jgi:hypothetical protein
VAKFNVCKLLIKDNMNKNPKLAKYVKKEKRKEYFD